MKKLGLKLLAGGILIAVCTLTSCKSSGYGCDYGFTSHENENNISEDSECIETKITYQYTKVTRE